MAIDIAKMHYPFNKSFFHVSIITDDKGNFLSAGINGIKTHPMNRQYKYRTDDIHSELAAYLSIRWMDINFNLINFRINNQLELRNSKPCKCCHSWLMTTGVEEIWYSTNEGDIIRL